MKDNSTFLFDVAIEINDIKVCLIPGLNKVSPVKIITLSDLFARLGFVEEMSISFKST